MIIFFFAIVAVMRVAQQICNKKASDKVNDAITFFHYGGYYQLLSMLCSLIVLCIVGFDGFNLPTVLCALVSALLFALDLYSGIEAVKGANLVVCNMFGLGGLFLPCVLGIFLFDEPMNVWQWIGLFAFAVAIYLLSAKADKEGKADKKPFTLRTFVMLVLCFLSNGLVMVVQKYFALLVENRNEATYSFLTFGFDALMLYVAMAVVLLARRKRARESASPAVNEETPKTLKLSKLLLVCGASLAVALFAINLIITTLASEVPSVILFTVSNAISIIITCLVGALCFKEKLTVKNAIGLAVGFLSILIVNVG